MAVETASSAIIPLKSKETKPRSLWQIAMRRYLRHRMAVLGTVTLLGIIIFVVGGSFFFRESQGNMTRLRGREAAPGAMVSIDRNGASGEEVRAIMGTDISGRDVFVRVIYGGQISLAIGVTSMLISITLGTSIGLMAGFFGGWVDAILSRITEVFLSIPALILLLVLSSVFRQDTATINIFGRTLSRTVLYIVFLIGFTSWMPLSRIVRSQVLSLKEQEYIVAARAIGVRSFSIIVRHLLPNVVAPIVVAATLGVGTAIITEAYLSFLGFGVQPPTATWGNIIDGAQGHIDTRWWLWMFPGLFIVLTVLAINFIGDGLRDALDPRSIE